MVAVKLCLITLTLLHTIAGRSVDIEPTVMPSIETNSSIEMNEDSNTISAHTIGICEPYETLMNADAFDFAASGVTVIMRWS